MKKLRYELKAVNICDAKKTTLTDIYRCACNTHAHTRTRTHTHTHVHTHTCHSLLLAGCCLGFDVVVVSDVGDEERLLSEGLGAAGELALVVVVIPRNHQLLGGQFHYKEYMKGREAGWANPKMKYWKLHELNKNEVNVHPI